MDFMLIGYCPYILFTFYQKFEDVLLFGLFLIYCHEKKYFLVSDLRDDDGGGMPGGG